MSDQSAKIAQFVAITGADADVAKEFLTATSWNVDQGIARYFDNPSPDQFANSGAAAPVGAGSPAVRAPDAAQFDTLVGPGPGGNSFISQMMGGLSAFAGAGVAQPTREPFRDYSTEWGKAKAGSRG